MARQKDDDRRAGLVMLDAPAEKPAPPAESAEVTDARDEMIARLNAQIAALKADAAAKQDRHTARRRGVYRVSLQDAPQRMASVTVLPREMHDRDKNMDTPTVEYDALDLFLSAEGVNIQDTAWRRYARANKLPPEMRSRHRVRVEAGAMTPHLDITADSPADAEAIFRRYAGILSTDKPFKTVLLDAEGAAGAEEAAADTGNARED